MKNLIPLLVILNIHLSNAQPSSWLPSGIGGGGSLFYPSISPHNVDEMFVPCDMTNLFHTENAGETWSVIAFDQFTVRPVSQIGYTSDPNILFGINMDFGWDIWFPSKSSDGGKTWQTLNNSPLSNEAYHLFSDAKQSNRFVMADWCDIYITKDGGNNFDLIYSVPNGCPINVWIAGVFWDGNDIYIGTNLGLLVSNDNGTNFALNPYLGLPSGSGFISMTGAKQNGEVSLNGLVINNSADLYTGMHLNDWWGKNEIYQLNLQGNGYWEHKSLNLFNEGEFLLQASMALDNTSTIYLSGYDAYSFLPIVYKSEDHGNTWLSVFQTSNNQNITTGWSGDQGDRGWWYGEKFWGLSVAPYDHNRVIVTDFGFTHISKNGGMTWQQTYVKKEDENPSGQPTPQHKSYASNGLENTSSWWVNWTSPENLFVGYSDIVGIRSEDGGQKWSFDFEGNSWNSNYHQTIHPDNGTLYSAVSDLHDIYQSTTLQDVTSGSNNNGINNKPGAILYSIDQGRNWSLLHDFGTPVIWVEIDPVNAERMYASVIHNPNGGIYYTDNLSDGINSTWQKLPAPPRTEGHPLSIKVLNDQSVVCSYSARRNSSGAFTPSSGVFHWDGNFWTDLSHPNMIYWTKDIIVDPYDANQDTWYACVHSGWGGAPNNKGGLYKTIDRGQSWNEILTLDRVESATIHPTNPNEIYVTTEYEGLWYSDNSNALNPSFTLLDAYPFQHPNRVFFNPYNHNEIWVTSFGNGLRKGYTQITHLSSSANSNFDLYPNPSKGLLKLDGENVIAYSIYNINGQKIYEGSNANSKTHDLPEGVYEVVVKLSDQTVFSKKWLVIK